MSIAPAARLTVPGSSERFLAKAQGLPADEVILDLEDAVAPAPSSRPRGAASSPALVAGGRGGSCSAVRVNGATSPWAYRDVIEIVEQPGGRLDAIVLPKVSGPPT